MARHMGLLGVSAYLKRTDGSDQTYEKTWIGQARHVRPELFGNSLVIEDTS